MARELKINVTIDDKGAVRKLNAIEGEIKDIGGAAQRSSGQVSKLGSFAKSAASSFGGFVAAQATIATLTRSWRALTQFVGSSITLFAEQELRTKLLTQALIAQGNAAPELVGQYQALASQFQQTTVFGDELILKMQALLVQVGDVAPAQMGRALKASTDLASGLGIDLRTATELVAKAFAGEISVLKRYGIIIDEATLKSEGIEAVLRTINEQFGGQAQAAVDTYSGKVAQLSNTWGDFKEQVGGAVAQSQTLTLAIQTVTDQLTRQTSGAEETKTSWTELLSAYAGVKPFIDVARAIEDLSAQINIQRETIATAKTDWEAYVESLSLGAREIKPVNDAWDAFNETIAEQTRVAAESKAAAEANAKAFETLTEKTWAIERAYAAAIPAGSALNAVLRESENRAMTTAISMDNLSGVIIQNEADFTSLSNEIRIGVIPAVESAGVTVDSFWTGPLSNLGGIFNQFINEFLPGFGGAFRNTFDAIGSTIAGLFGGRGGTSGGTAGQVISSGMQIMNGILATALPIGIGLVANWATKIIGSLFSVKAMSIETAAALAAVTSQTTASGGEHAQQGPGGPLPGQEDPTGGSTTPPPDVFTGTGGALGGLVTAAGTMQRFRHGGFTRGTDTVRALLTPGEFVVSRRGVQTVGVPALQRMNRGGGGPAVTTVVHVHGGFLDSPRTRKTLADLVSNTIMADLKRQKVFRATA